MAGVGARVTGRCILFPDALENCGNKNRRQNPVWEFTKTIIPFALVGYEVIITNSHYAFVGYFITSYPTRAHRIIVIYYMASSASGQDEPNRALWLATRAGKMEPSYPLGTTRCIPQAKCPQKPYNKSFIDQVCSDKMAGYWPRSFFASLWTSTSSRSINTQKKNLANIQPSWPHTWSITHKSWPNKLGQ